MQLVEPVRPSGKERQPTDFSIAPSFLSTCLLVLKLFVMNKDMMTLYMYILADSCCFDGIECLLWTMIFQVREPWKEAMSGLSEVSPAQKKKKKKVTK